MNKPPYRQPQYPRQPQLNRQEYWFVAFLHEGRPVVWILPDVHDAAMANRKGLEKLPGKQFVTFCMGTKDLTKANEQGRALLLEQTADPDTVLRRARHIDFEVKPDNKTV